jgi:outer membrane protein TolC
MPISRSSGCAFFWALLAIPCSAQSTPPGPQVLELSFEKAIELAISPHGNSSVQLAQESVKLAHSRYTQVRADLLPNLEGSFNGQNQTVNLRALGLMSTPMFMVPEEVGPFTTYDARVRLSQNILNLSAIRRSQAAHEDVHVAEAESDRTRERVAGAIAKLYAAALRTDAEVETAKANVQLAEALRDLAVNRESVGEGTDVEVTRAKLGVARNQQRLLAAETAYTRAHLDLIHALNLEWNTTLRLTGKLGGTPEQPFTPEQAVEVALKSRADFRVHQNRMDSARLNYSAAKLERVPSVAGYADYGDLSGVATHTAGVVLRLPLFDGGRLESDRAQTLSLVRQEQIRDKELRNQVELEIRQAVATLASAKSQVVVAEQAVALAEDELARARRRYEAGITNSVEVVDAETRLENARDDHIAALFNSTDATIDLAQAMGTVKTISF